MLNFVYYPVSFILWCWHEVFGPAFGAANAVSWALAIVFLVFTLRAILLQPAVKQVRSMRRMQRIAPQMKAIQRKHAHNRQRQAEEMHKLQREHGFNPLGGCLPLLLQVPMFLGLNHVLRNFTQYPHRSNYFFPSSGVRSYLGSKLFGAHLGDAIVNTPLVTGHGLHHALWMWQVAPAAIPLMIIAAIATHCTARRSVHRPLSMNVAGTAQSVTMGRIAMWVLPLGVLAFGVVLPVGLLLYLASNNIWTLVQQHLVFVRIDRGEEKQQAKAQHQRSALAPKPGQKPGVAKNARP